MDDHKHQIYRMAYRSLVRDCGDKFDEEKMKSVVNVVDAVLKVLRDSITDSGSAWIKGIGTINKTTVAKRHYITLDPSRMFLADLNYCEKEKFNPQSWNEEEEAEFARLAKIMKSELHLTWDWVAACMTTKFNKPRTYNTCRVKANRMKNA